MQLCTVDLTRELQRKKMMHCVYGIIWKSHKNKDGDEK